METELPRAKILPPLSSDSSKEKALKIDKVAKISLMVFVAVGFEIAGYEKNERYAKVGKTEKGT
jgi:hypothetical protein